jgi:alpha-glucosidase
MPPWAIRSRWEDPPLLIGHEAMAQLYGGDLPGVEAHLDHLEGLGINAVYLTPFFPGESNHRYNASSFDEVDPALGGDEALASLIGAMHRRGIRVVGDLTANHCGDTHPWFRRAKANPQSAEAAFFFRSGTGYEYWQGVPTLPKFDHRSPELRRRLYEGPDSVAARWLRPPFDLDGWRIDVANMAGRFRDVDENHLLATSIRRTMEETKPGTYLLAEHNHDASADLLGDGWHGTMSYAGFARPVWRWLGDPDAGRGLDFAGAPPVVPGLEGVAAARTIDRFRAAIPWRSWTHNLTILGSHDTARWRSVAGSRERALVGAGILLTFPGVPCIFQGDEVGIEGPDRHAARRPMPWDPDCWDGWLLDGYRDLVHLRREHPALRDGGFRWVHAGTDVLAYLRESPEERILVRASRAPHESLTLSRAALGLRVGGTHLLAGRDLTSVGETVSLPGDGPTFDAWVL